MWTWLRTRLGAPVDMTSLVVFRVLFGLLLSVSAARFMLKGWVARCFSERTFFFKYWGFSWLETGSAETMTWVYTALCVLGLMIAVGAFYRVAISLFFALFTYAELTDVTNYLNHYYLVSLLAFLMCFMPLGERASVDVWRRACQPRTTVPGFMLYVLRFQIGVVYVYAGLAKLGSDWLLHGQPLGLWLSGHSDMPLIGPWLLSPQVALVASWGGFLHDLLVVPLLLWPRTRAWAYAGLLSFHLLTSTWFNIGIFPCLMPLGAMLFFPPSLRGGLRDQVDGRASGTAPVGRRVGVALALYCGLQLLWPLRSHLVGGNVLWHEQGMRFSWRVMLRDKHGSLRFRVGLPGGRQVIVPPRRYVTAEQEREMAGQPDLILQLAHHIADDFAARGHGQVSVRVDALVSLNGREPVPMIDPQVNLAAVPDGFAKGAWILPPPVSPPLRLTPRAQVASLEP